MQCLASGAEYESKLVGWLKHPSGVCTVVGKEVKTVHQARRLENYTRTW